jgi:hypothetical protein
MTVGHFHVVADAGRVDAAYAEGRSRPEAHTALHRLAPGGGAEGCAGRAWIVDHCGVSVGD